MKIAYIRRAREDRTHSREEEGDTVAEPMSGHCWDKHPWSSSTVRHPDSSFYRTTLSHFGLCCADIIRDPSQPNLPCTILEVSFSQRRKNLWKLAQSYVNHPHRSVNCIILIELPYRKRDKTIGSSAAVSIWRARSVEYHYMDIRHNAKSPRNSSFMLYLKDLLPSKKIPNASVSAVIEIRIASLIPLLIIAKSRMENFELLRTHSMHTPIDVLQLSRVAAREERDRAYERRAGLWDSWFRSIFTECI